MLTQNVYNQTINQYDENNILINNKKRKKKRVNYAKWGYIFLIPFFLSFAFFTMVPLFTTIFYSFFENFYSTALFKQIDPKFIGLSNYINMLKEESFIKYLSNTATIWLMGFIPQIVVALLLAVLFTDLRLKLKHTGFFKTVIYMPNLVMAAAFGMLFFTIFNTNGPIANILSRLNITERFDYGTSKWISRGLVALMNFLMWFGNTTILLMAGIMGIDPGLYEAARIDGAGSTRIFFKITFPLLIPIFIYVLLTALIGGLQLFDVPQVLTAGSGDPARTCRTLIMYMFTLMGPSKDYGKAGTVATLMFLITVLLSLVLFFVMFRNDKNVKGNKKKRREFNV